MYRNYRNLEASFIDYITTELAEDGWTDIRVEKSFAEVYKQKLPCICINMEESAAFDREIGSRHYLEDITMSVRIFAENDGQRLDLASWALQKIMRGIDYYEYNISKGETWSKTLVGAVTILKVIANKKELKNTDNLDYYDRYRHLITFKCRIGLS